VSKTVRLI